MCADVPVAILVTAINTCLPQIVKIITSKYEIHNNNVSVQRSILFKLMAVRCVNSALLVYFTIDYDQMFSLESLEKIQNILIADAIATPLFRFSNIIDKVKQYVIAPLTSITQEEFNKHWQGAEWNLAERYTDVLKSVFIGVFFSVPLPTSLFVTAFCMLTTYLVDRYSLFNLWKRKSKFGPDLSFAARYFYFGVVFAHLYISLVYFANWPYRGIFHQDKGDKPHCGFLVCHPDNDDVMTTDQERIVRLYSLFTIIAFAVILLWGVPYRIGKFLHKVFIPYSKATGVIDTDVPFREVGGTPAYVPLIKRPSFLTPYIVCNIGNVPKRFIPTHLGLHHEDLPDPKDFSIFNKAEFPEISEKALRNCMSDIRYYEEEDGDSVADGASISSPLPVKARGENTAEDGIELEGIRVHNRKASGDVDSPEYYRESITLTETPSSEEDMELPTGWDRKVGPDGKKFYVDHNTRTTHWVHPFLQAAANVTAYPSDEEKASEGARRQKKVYITSTGVGPMLTNPGGDIDEVFSKDEYEEDEYTSIVVLPPGWEQKTTDGGVPYFINHINKSTHWEVPDVAWEAVDRLSLARETS